MEGKLSSLKKIKERAYDIVITGNTVKVWREKNKMLKIDLVWLRMNEGHYLNLQRDRYNPFILRDENRKALYEIMFDFIGEYNTVEINESFESILADIV